MKFKKYLNESKDKVIYSQGELWVTNGQSSGQTAQLPDFSKYLTNKKDDKNYDSLVSKISKFAKNNKPLKSQGTSKLFKIPEYPQVKMGQTYDIWGGKIKPLRMIYMIVDDNGSIVTVNLFKNKNEANNWIKSIS